MKDCDFKEATTEEIVADMKRGVNNIIERDRRYYEIINNPDKYPKEIEAMREQAFRDLMHNLTRS